MNPSENKQSQQSQPEGANQLQAMNLMAVQNMQDCLRMFVFNMNVAHQRQAPGTQPGPELTNPVQVFSTTPANVEPITTLSQVTEPNIARNPTKKSRQKSKTGSGRLWKLMAKKYAKKKIQIAEEDVEPKEAPEEGETYRKLYGLLVPVLKTPGSNRRKNICGHPERHHYARGLCGSCYHRVGRGKKPWNCEHETLYALGLCHKCYTAKNRQMKKESQTPVKQESGQSEEMKVEEEDQPMKTEKEACFETKKEAFEEGAPGELPE